MEMVCVLIFLNRTLLSVIFILFEKKIALVLFSLLSM